jgi:hypothetical protein
LRAELAKTTSSQLLGRFIQDRAGSDDYRKFLGLPALIHRDFARLSKMFDEQRKAEESAKTGETKEGDSNVVNRIILYVDDLDRCPPDRVVEVLRAIHLLLAFPLFVVIVGVDARWVSRALKKEHRFLLRATPSEPLDVDDEPLAWEGGATPEDYLEKIFQIPFWLSPMTNETCGDLLSGIAGPAAAPKSAAVTNGVDMARPETPRQNETELPKSSPPPDDDGGPPVPGRDDGARSRRREDKGDGATARGRPARRAPGVLLFTDAEKMYLKELAPLLKRSPRAVKRFVNTYRLLKVAAHVGDTGTDAAFQASMLVLAMKTGDSMAGKVALESLRELKDGQTPKEWAAAVKKGDDPAADNARDIDGASGARHRPRPGDVSAVLELVTNLQTHGVTDLSVARAASALACRVSFSQPGE